MGLVNCLICGTDFEQRRWRPTNLFCSKRCSAVYNNQQPRYRKPLIERFWHGVRKTEYCWIWTGNRTKAGYGMLSENNKRNYLHRLSWEIHNGPISKGLFVCHKCDNPPCVNPDHLFLGTQKENMQDCAKKGRINKAGKKGSASAHAKLTESQVLDIRQRHAQGGITQQQLAREYDMEPSGISLIIRRVNWKHI